MRVSCFYIYISICILERVENGDVAPTGSAFQIRDQTHILHPFASEYGWMDVVFNFEPRTT